MLRANKYKIEIEFEYYDYELADEDIEAMLEDMEEEMDESGCINVKASVTRVIDLVEKVG